VNPDGTLFAVLGDDEDGLVLDPKSGKVSVRLFFFCSGFQVIGFLANPKQVTFPALL
jgi:hypothetical protein